MKRVLHVEVSSPEESLAQFGEALEETIQGVEVEPFEGIGLENMVDLLKTLTPKRWELIQRLKRLKREGPLTLYALAKVLGRDYKNVHLDVRALEDWGIIERDKAGRVGAMQQQLYICGGRACRRHAERPGRETG